MLENDFEAPPNAVAGRRGIKAYVTRSIRSIALRMTKRFGRDTDVFINTPYLTKRTLFRLFLRLRQLPVLWNTIPAPRADVDMGQRAWSLKHAASSDFESFFLEIVPAQLPRFCLEGYRQLLTRIREQPWPRKPRLLYTANVLWHDVISMGYFAEMTEQGVPLLYGQHGGGYGTAKFVFAREHESAIANRYLAWGRGGVGCTHEHNVGITKLDDRQPGPFDRNRRLLFVTLNLSRYSYRLCSESARNFLADLEGSFAMISALRNDVQKVSLVRLSPTELGWHLPERWRDHFPDISVDPGYADIYKLMRTSRLVVFNYNLTGFLETLAMGIPTVLLCDFQKYPLKSDAIPFYNSLQKVGICHATPESAATHINAVWDSVDAWWSMTDVQEAISVFRRQYCDLRGNVLGRVLEPIKKDMLNCQ
jgi:putative transferase (TIGR04331 family)